MPKRLAGYDYSQPGFYFVTICIQHHRLMFGTIVDDQVALKGPGQIAQSVWVRCPNGLRTSTCMSMSSCPTIFTASLN